MSSETSGPVYGWRRRAEPVSNLDRIKAAIEIVARYGGIDGAHHKQWLLDQVLRALMPPALYAEFVRTRTDGPNGEPDYYSPWDEGIAP